VPSEVLGLTFFAASATAKCPMNIIFSPRMPITLHSGPAFPILSLSGPKGARALVFVIHHVGFDGRMPHS
jgi:hypothetical protein